MKKILWILILIGCFLVYLYANSLWFNPATNPSIIIPVGGYYCNGENISLVVFNSLNKELTNKDINISINSALIDIPYFQPIASNQVGYILKNYNCGSRCDKENIIAIENEKVSGENPFRIEC